MKNMAHKINYSHARILATKLFSLISQFLETSLSTHISKCHW